MPGKYKKTYKKKIYKKTYKKKYGKKKYTAGKKMLLWKQPGTAYPPTFYTKLKYCDTITMTSTLGVAVYEFAGNGCYDPDITGTGHQPYFWDQLTAVYKYYAVVSSKITVTGAVDVGSSQNVNLGLLAYQSDTTPNSFTGFTQLMEQPYNRYVMFVNSPNEQKTLSLYKKSSGVLNTKSYLLKNDQAYFTDIGWNPSSTILWKYKL